MATHDELFKDKIEVSLDGRQIFYLFFGGAVIATLVFVLGVMVGRRVEARAIVETGSLATDPLAALDRLEGKDSQLAFASALRGEDVSLGAVDVTLRSAEPATGGPVAEAVAEEPRDLSNEPATASPHQAEDASSQESDNSEASETSEKQPNVAPAAQAKPEPAAANDEKDEAKQPAAKPSHDNRFTLQVGSFQAKEEADIFFREIDGKGYEPYMVEADVPGKGKYYRVRIGGYPSFEDAVAAKKGFEDDQHVIAYVTRIK